MNEGGNLTWLPSTAVLNTVATFLLVLVGIFGIWATNNSLELSERAWLGVGNVAAIQPLETGKPIHYAIILTNTGKEPAVDLNSNPDTDTVPFPANNDFANFLPMDNKTCSDLSPVSGGRIVLPGGIIQSNTDSARGNHTASVDSKFLSGDTVIVTKGCVAYRTFGKIHKTAYCFVFYEAKALPAPQGISTAANQKSSPVQNSGVPAIPPSFSYEAPTGVVLQSSACLTGNAAD